MPRCSALQLQRITLDGEIFRSRDGLNIYLCNRMQTLRTVCIAIIGIAFSISATSAEIDSLNEELTQMRSSPTEYRLAYWAPLESFLLSNPNASDSDKKQIAAMLNGYTLFLVANARVGAMGALTPRPRGEILSTTFLHLNETSRLTPVPDDQLKGDIKAFIAVIKPFYKSLAGSYGEALEAVVFRDAGVDGESALRATGEGKVRLTVAGETFVWRLPLGALLPAMVDPVTHEQFPGNFTFNPYTGKRLVTK